MQTGDFFNRYFSNLDIKPNGEADVRCPFLHSKGYDTNPSAHVNVEKGVFHCKTCRAEGRFSVGGMSEISFIAKVYNISYEQAVQFMSAIQGDDTDYEIWYPNVQNLLANGPLLEYLATHRGLQPEWVNHFMLGYMGDGIAYPVFVYGELCDVRTYNPNPEPGEPKIKSRKGASPLLFPFDHWITDPNPTVLCAGENDTLLTRAAGFNALTSTGGEGSFPKLFLGLFKGKHVYIVYDCDEAGRKASRRVAFLLHEVGAIVHIVDLGLPGTKQDKDLTDYFIKHGHSPADLYQLMQDSPAYSPDDYREDKNEHYPLVDLWNVQHGEHSGKRLSSRVLMSGKYDMPMEVPTAIEWRCNNPGDSGPCEWCPKRRKSGWWTLDESNLDEVLELVEVSPAQKDKAIDRFIGLPFKCPGVIKSVRAKKSVTKAVFTPDVETEDILSGFKSVEQYAYVLEKAVDSEIDLEDGQRYRIYFRRYAHPLQDQRIFLVVDRAEASDNPINSFKMSPDLMDQLKVFQGDPFQKMAERAERAKDIVGGNYTPRSVVYAVDIMYHSPLQFNYNGRLVDKGYPEGAIIGESRTGKTDTAIKLQRYYGVGNFTACKGATVAGLLGGADKLPSGGHRIKWGKIPRNHKGLVVLDELSGMPQEVMSKLTDMRSSGVATVEKIVSSKAPAMARMLWISNPRPKSNGKSLNVNDYPTGVEIVLDLVGSDEDIARFDFVMVIAKSDYISPMDEAPMKAFDRDLYRNLIYWVWSRNANQVLWNPGVESYVWQMSQELNEKYDTDVKFFGAEAWKKLARLAVACAGATFSCNANGDSIVVTKAHVDWAATFLVRCYDNDLFRLADYVQSKRIYTTTNETVNAIFAGLLHSHPMLMRTLSTQTECTLQQLQLVSGLDRNDFTQVISKLTQEYLIQTSAYSVMPTRRFRLAAQAYRQNYQQVRMVPVSQQGGVGI